MNQEQWRHLTPAQRAQHEARYGPPPAAWTTTPTAYLNPPAKRRRWPWIAAGVVALLVIVGLVNGSHGSSATATATPTTPTVASLPAVQNVPVAPAPAAAAPAQQTGVSEGTYQVGTDIPAGRYKTTGPGGTGALDICYWERDKDDSGDVTAIITNDLFKGPGSVTVKKGEFVKLTGACTWTKQ